MVFIYFTSRLFKPFMRDRIKNQRNSHCLGESKKQDSFSRQIKDKNTDDGLIGLFEHNLTAQKYLNFPVNCLPEMLEDVSIKICAFSSTVDQQTLQDKKYNFQIRGSKITR
jgi:hypothetical protein